MVSSEEDEDEVRTESFIRAMIIARSLEPAFNEKNHEHACLPHDIIGNLVAESVSMSPCESTLTALFAFLHGWALF